ncbi:hypothetical protein PIB30_088301, partial [Stylosanthes scabra]|nr:hypothetical protein [Stylosanthes scabra]
QEFTTERCWTSRSFQILRAQNNYYELLGVSTESNAQQIREAYRKLQKKHHPDIVGQKGHEYTLLLNEAYEVLMRNDLKRKYDESIKQMGIAFGENNLPLGNSTWKGPIRSQALFVDENACIGCRECVHHASNTFIMDEARGCARVKVQDGDMDKNIEVHSYTTQLLCN